MPTKWPFLCCPRDDGEKIDFQKPYARVKGKARAKKAPDKKVTWTRKSLLMNEHSEIHESPFDQRTFQHESDRLSSDYNHQYNEVELTTFNDFKSKRRTAQEVFEDTNTQSPNSTNARTTFPWMNEEYVPNGRNATRLGISSVQINAKRNELANRNTQGYGQAGPRSPYLQSQSFNAGENRDKIVYAKPMVRTNGSQSNLKTVPNGHQNNTRVVPNGHGFRGNVTSVINKANTVTVPAVLGRTSERPMILHAPRSDIGLRVVESPGRNRGTQVPKLGDYMLLKPDTKVPINQGHSDNTRQSGSSTPALSYNQQDNRDQSDVSFSSEVTFKKSNIGTYSTDVSLQRSVHPAIFAAKSNANKYERLKSRKDAKLHKNKASDGKGPHINLESMYGYVPRAVQHVHASNALAGGKLDDFFMQRMEDRELQKFANINRNEALVSMTSREPFCSEEQRGWRDVMETSYLGSNGPIGGRPKSVPAYMNTGQNNIRPSSETGNVRSSGQNQTDYANIKVGLQQIKLAPPPSRKSTPKHNATDRLPSNGQPKINNYVNIETRTSDYAKDENENKVIMIDFPPNVDKDTGSNSSKVKANGEQSNISTATSSRDKERLMANPLPENEDVLY